MEKLEAYKIDLKGLQDDVVTRSLVADDDFFAAVQGNEIQYGNVALEMQLRQTAGTFEVSLQFHGDVQVLCDRCLEPMRLPVEGDATLKVRLGDEYEDDGEMIVVPENDGILDLSWQVYEQIALQIPLSHVHEDGECNEEMQSVLLEHEAHDAGSDEEGSDADNSQDGGGKPTDPRWDALKKLISTNN